MKKSVGLCSFICIAFLCGGLLGVFGCEEERTVLAVGNVSEQWPGEGGLGYFSVYTNAAWEVVSLDNASWIHFEPSSGNGTQMVVVTLDINNTGAERSTALLVTAGDLSQHIIISQPANTNNLSITPSLINAIYAPGTYTVAITGDVAWTTSVDPSDASWFTLSSSSGYGNGAFTVQVMPYAESVARSATVTITGGGLAQNLTVIQHPYMVPEVLSITGASRCGPGTLTLSATPSFGNTIDWYDAATGGNKLAEGTNYTPAVTTTSAFYTEARNPLDNTVSTVRQQVTATVNNIPVPVFATAPLAVCNGAFATVTASGGSSYCFSTTGYCSDWSATDSYTFSMPALGAGIVYLSAITNAGCTASTDTVITAIPAPTVVSVTPATRCDAGTLTISAVPGADAVIDWYTNVTGGAVIAGGIGTSSYTTPAIASSRIYYAGARSTNGSGCVSVSRTPVPAVIYPLFAAGAIEDGGETITAGSTPAPINSLSVAAGGDDMISYEWYKSGVPISGSNTAAYTPPAADAAVPGTYVYTRYAKDNTCVPWTLSQGSWTVVVVP